MSSKSESKVHFPPETLQSVSKPSRPFRKKSKIPSFSTPRAYAIMLPWEDIAARAAKKDPAVQKFIDTGDQHELTFVLNREVRSICDQASEIWPNAFVPLLDGKYFSTSLKCLGFSDNTNRDKRAIPTAEQIQKIRDLLDLNGEQYKLGWYRDLYPEDRR
ncbi:hypothetical protein GYMLUDRAFT_87018 [Collybiopsis luxurians FD-317 M1]|uniref:Uncharacterized protein n=1 Tax=Collybiopsis luxurians FD-317 M1 TaxID=944289 RepID=A0A0D0C4D5_9AGAR|nr:hypothetical protein GYMLUDRAFT_87018 [Collybiopsis luxurians FD-317 M1]